MSYEKKELSLVIFKNDKKEGQQPDYTGKIHLNGVDREVVLWNKVSKNGLPFFSGHVNEVKKPYNNAKPKQEQRQESKPLVDDEIPW